MSKTALLRASFAAIYYSGLANLLTSKTAGLGHIFCLHHVCPGSGTQSGFSPNSNLEVSPEFLDGLILSMKQKGIALVSVDEALTRLRSPQKSQQRFAVFTLDDGYRDNLVHALPVFERHQCPFTVYVAPRIAEGTCELWWRLLEAVITKAPEVKLEIDGEPIQLSTQDTAEKYRAWSILAPKIQSMDEHNQRELIRSLCSTYNVDWQALCRDAAMTWDEIRSLAKNPLATIGAHTLNHYNLLKLTVEEAASEIQQSKLQIEKQLGATVKHFAYPYGNVDAASPREFELCKAAGFKSAVVTRLGALWPEHVDHVHALPRIMISGRYQSRSAVEALVSGIPAILANGFKRLNVN
jgi:peptidoglycan/xylan/chitin deacetylase (PgdA/CDA1 family)